MHAGSGFAALECRAAIRAVAGALLLPLAACGLSHREGWYGCDPLAPGCPPGWFCRDDHFCWSTRGDGGNDVPDVEAPDDAGEDAADVPEDGEDVGPDDVPGDGAEADASCPPETCNELDDDCDGATDEGLWCVVAGVPADDDLRAIWGTSAAELWVVGHGGTILRGDGAAWVRVDAGVTADLRGVWGASSDVVLAVGMFGAIRHWDGASWNYWAGGSEDLFAVGGSSPKPHPGSGWVCSAARLRTERA